MIADSRAAMNPPKQTNKQTMNKQSMNRLRLVFFLAPIVLWPLAAAADPLDQWHWRNPLPTANRVNAMIYANGRFMGVDSGGEILTSTNGLDWTIRDCGYSCGLDGIAFGNGLYVAVGCQDVYSPGEADGYPFVLTSPDGVTWTSQSVGVSAPGALLSVCFGSGTFVAVGSGGMPSIWSSPDGTNWNAQGPAGLAGDLGLGYLDAVAYANGEFVAVGPATDSFRSFEPILTSPDGVNWTTNQVPWIGLLYGVDVLNDAFVVTGMKEAINKAGLLFSGDGSTWTNLSFTTTTGGSSFLYSACYGAGTYVAAGYTSQGGIIFSSTNGRVWAVTNVDPDSFGGFMATAYGNGAFVVGGGGMLTSTNGSNWVKLGSGVTSSLFGIVYDLGQFVAAGSGGIMLCSTDGLSWTALPSGVTNDLCGIASGDGRLVAVGVAGMILTSSNAVNWTAHAVGLTTNAVKDICHGNGMFAAVTDGGEILASTNGTGWAIQSSGVAADLEGIAFGQGTFVAVGASGSAHGPSLEDGTNWVSSVPGPVTLAGVAYGNGAFLAFSSRIHYHLGRRAQLVHSPHTFRRRHPAQPGVLRAWNVRGPRRQHRACYLDQRLGLDRSQSADPVQPVWSGLRQQHLHGRWGPWNRPPVRPASCIGPGLTGGRPAGWWIPAQRHWACGTELGNPSLDEPGGLGLADAVSQHKHYHARHRQPYAQLQPAVLQGAVLVKSGGRGPDRVLAQHCGQPLHVALVGRGQHNPCLRRHQASANARSAPESIHETVALD